MTSRSGQMSNLGQRSEGKVVGREGATMKRNEWLALAPLTSLYREVSCGLSALEFTRSSLYADCGLSNQPFRTANSLALA